MVATDESHAVSGTDCAHDPWALNEPAGEKAAPINRTPTCTGSDVTHQECGWKRGKALRVDAATTLALTREGLLMEGLG